MNPPEFGHYSYLVYLYAWAGPILLLQWSLGWPELRRRWRPMAAAAAASTLYLSVADQYALGSGIWQINPEKSTGIFLGTLPLEEGLFFLTTNAMVTQSVALLIARELTPTVVWERLAAIGQALGRNWPGGLAAASLAVLAGALMATILGAPSPLYSPWEVVMVLTPVPLAAWIIDNLGEASRPLGLLGGFALYLFPAALLGSFAGLGWGGLAAAVLGSVGLWIWLAKGTHLLVAAILALGPLATPWVFSPAVALPIPAGRLYPRRALLFRILPLAVALGLTVLWLVERRVRNQLSGLAGQPIFEPPSVLPRTPSFPVDGQPPEVTPVQAFYVVSKNVEDPALAVDSWRLRIGGQVERPLSLDFDSLLRMPRVDQYTTLRCVSNPVGWPLMSNGFWSGVPVRELLRQAGVAPSAGQTICRGVDGHYEDLPVTVMMAPDTLLAYGLNGAFLERRHGYPVRLVVPGRYGFKNVKWLGEIEVREGDSLGFWPSRGWTRDGVMVTVSRIDLIRREDGGLLVAGVAMAGTRGISAVQVRLVQGEKARPWESAVLHSPSLGPASWTQWQARLIVPPAQGGRVQVRAVDGQGRAQSEDETGPYPDGAAGLHSVEVPA